MDGSINGTNEVPSLDKASRSDGIGTTMPIAIVGMACRLPGKVSDLESFWELCLAAKNTWTEIPKDRMSTSAFYHPDPEKTGAVRLVPSVLKPREADPMQPSSTSRERTSFKKESQRSTRLSSTSPPTRPNQLTPAIACSSNALTRRSRTVASQSVRSQGTRSVSS